MNQLLQDRKIARATHNISAYRIVEQSTSAGAGAGAGAGAAAVVIQDCDDDGEEAAGGRLLHLLSIVDARNVFVVVSRWFGGVLLGPARFSHINNAARMLVRPRSRVVASVHVVHSLFLQLEAHGIHRPGAAAAGSSAVSAGVGAGAGAGKHGKKSAGR